MRTFHIGGAANVTWKRSDLKAKKAGKVRSPASAA
jgi:hypothetical protein